MNNREVLGIVMARGGSKGVPKKNIVLCAGKPLLAYTIEAARRSTGITRLILSTDDSEIAAVGKEYGIEVPFLRPAELAGDHVLDLPVALHALQWLKENENYEPDAVVHLRPTTPLKKSADIDHAVELLFSNTEAHSVRSICEPIYSPFKMYKYEKSQSPFLQTLLTHDFPEVYAAYPEPYNMPRQKLPTIWRHSGYVDVIRTSTLHSGSISGTKILPFEFERWRDIDIDAPRDLIYAEMAIKSLTDQGKNTWE